MVRVKEDSRKVRSEMANMQEQLEALQRQQQAEQPPQEPESNSPPNLVSDGRACSPIWRHTVRRLQLRGSMRTITFITHFQVRHRLLRSSCIYHRAAHRLRTIRKGVK